MKTTAAIETAAAMVTAAGYTVSHTLTFAGVAYAYSVEMTGFERDMVATVGITDATTEELGAWIEELAGEDTRANRALRCGLESRRDAIRNAAAML